jgi:hypothetical protein
MIPSLGSPRASFVGSPTIVLPTNGVEWRYVGPDALEDVTVRWCQNIKCLSGCAGGCHHFWCQNIKCRVVSTATAVPSKGWVMGVGGCQLGPGCAPKIL